MISFLSARDGLFPDPALHAHLPAERLWQPSDHNRPGNEQAHADRHQLLPVVAGVQWPHDGRILHAFYPHPQHPGGLHLRSRNVQDHLLLYGWGHTRLLSIFRSFPTMKWFNCGTFTCLVSSLWPSLINTPKNYDKGNGQNDSTSTHIFWRCLELICY